MADLNGKKVIFKDEHQDNDIHHPDHDATRENFGEAVNIVLSGANSSLVLAEGVFLVGNSRVLTPAPTPVPTPAPAPSCAVSCEHDVGQWAPGGAKENQQPYGHKAGAFDKMGVFSKILDTFEGCDLSKDHGNFGQDLTAPLSKHFDAKQNKGCNWRDRRAGRIVATHDVAKMNTQTAFTKHRCFTMDKRCVCGCLDDAAAPWDFNRDGAVDAKDNRFQDGTLQGGAGKHSTRFEDHFSGQEVFHARKQTVRSLFKPKNVAGPVTYEEFNGNWNGAGEHTVSALETTTTAQQLSGGMDSFVDSR